MATDSGQLKGETDFLLDIFSSFKALNRFQPQIGQTFLIICVVNVLILAKSFVRHFFPVGYLK